MRQRCLSQRREACKRKFVLVIEFDLAFTLQAEGAREHLDANFQGKNTGTCEDDFS